MKIHLSITLQRPPELVGIQNNMRVLDVLVEKLDGICDPMDIGLSEPDKVWLECVVERDSSSGSFMSDEDEALTYALGRLIAAVDWFYLDSRVVSFEPDTNSD